MGNILNAVPQSLYEDGLEIPDAPPMSLEDERKWSRTLQSLKEKAIDSDGNWRTDKEHAEDVALYVDFKYKFVEAFSFIPTKEARKLMEQCQKGLNFGDLFQEGYIGLWKAVEGHQFRTGNRFVTYAGKAVRNAMMKFLDDHNRTIRVPSQKLMSIFVKSEESLTDEEICSNTGISQNTLSKVKSKMKEGATDDNICEYADIDHKTLRSVKFNMSNTRPLTDEEICNRAHIDSTTLRSIKEPIQSMSTPVSNGDDDEVITIGDTIADCSNTMASECAKSSRIRPVIMKALSMINQRAASVVIDHCLYGYSLKDIADAQICEGNVDEIGQLNCPAKPKEGDTICGTIRKPKICNGGGIAKDGGGNVIYRTVDITYVYHNNMWHRRGTSKQRVRQLLEKGKRQLQEHPEASKLLRAAMEDIYGGGD